MSHINQSIKTHDFKWFVFLIDNFVTQLFNRSAGRPRVIYDNQYETYRRKPTVLPPDIDIQL